MLGQTQIGLRDDFFALGGHSLLATQIISRTRQACDVELPLRALFEASELGAFAEQVRLIQASGKTNQQPPIEKVDRSRPVPLSYSQQRMWFLWQMEPDSPAYNSAAWRGCAACWMSVSYTHLTLPTIYSV